MVPCVVILKPVVQYHDKKQNKDAQNRGSMYIKRRSTYATPGLLVSIGLFELGKPVSDKREESRTKTKHKQEEAEMPQPQMFSYETMRTKTILKETHNFI